MDAKDIRIFCEMGFKYFDYSGINRRPSPKQIGKKLGLDEKTVRLRTRKMEREGFIQYYQVIPNLSLFGQSLACIYGFQANSVSAKRRALQQLLQKDSVLDAMDFLGEMFGVTLSSSSEEEAQQMAKTFSEITGTRCFPFMPPRHFPAIHLSLNELDWKLVKALRYNALRPTEEISRELGITYRMTDYRIAKLIESQALLVRAMINPKDPKGIIFYSLSLSLEGEGERWKDEICERYKEQTWWVFSPPGPMIIINLFATSIGEPEDCLLDALNQGGVRTGTLSIFKGWMEPKKPSWIDKVIEAKSTRKEA